MALVNGCAAAKNWIYSTQLRRAAGSVYANLVEGYGRGPGADRKRIYRIAKAECEEALGWIRQARNAEELTEGEFFNLLNRGVVIARMINGLVM